MSQTVDLWALLGDTLKRLESEASGLHEEYRQYMQCKKGCYSCCIDGFRVRYAEALKILEGFSQAPAAVAHAILTRLADESPEGKAHCPLLVDGACSLYEHRPSLCRAFGVLIETGKDISTCPLNFWDLPKSAPVKVLRIEPYYELLDEISQRLWAMQAHPGLPASKEAPMMTIRQFLTQMLTASHSSTAGDSIPAQNTSQ